MSNLSNLSKGGGNVKTPPSLASDNFQSSKWKGNYHLKVNGIIVESFEQVFKRIENNIIPICDKYIFGEEYGESKDTPHIEFAFTIKNGKRMRRSALKKLFQKEGIFLDKMKGTLQQQDYCLKEGNKVITNIKFPKPIKLVCENNLYKWQENIIDIIKNEPCDRIINWYWENKGGAGKTSFCKYLCVKHDAIMCGGKAADMKNCIVEYYKIHKTTPELILINLPRSFNTDYLSYPGIEDIKDMCFYSGKYEGGMIVGNNPHIFIFANEEPEYNKLSKDRWNVHRIF